MLPGFFIGDNDHELRDFSADHPLVQLRHDLLDVGFHLVVGRYYHGLDGPQVAVGEPETRN